MKNYRNKILPQTRLLTSSTRTSTILVSRTKISIARRSYPGKLPAGILGGIGKGPKLPNGTSSGTNLPPSNKESINLTPSQAKEAILNPNKTNPPYTAPQYNTPHHPHYTPNSATKDPFKLSQLDKQKELANAVQKPFDVTKYIEKENNNLVEKHQTNNFKSPINNKGLNPIQPRPSTQSVPITEVLPPKQPSSSNPEVAFIEQKNTSTSLEPTLPIQILPKSESSNNNSDSFPISSTKNEIPLPPPLPVPKPKLTQESTSSDKSPNKSAAPKIAFTEQIKALGEKKDLTPGGENANILPSTVISNLTVIDQELKKKHTLQINNQIDPEKKDLNNNSNFNPRNINNNNDNNTNLPENRLNEIANVADTFTTILTNSASVVCASEITKEISLNDFSNDLKTDTLITNYDKINDQEKEFIKEHYTKLQNRFNELKNEAWSTEKAKLLSDIKSFLNKYFELYPRIITEINRDVEEAQKLNPCLMSLEEVDRKNISEFLDKKQINTIRTPQEYQKELERIQQSLDILITTGPALPEPIFHEIIRRAGVTANNDAMYTNDMGIKSIQKEGEGPMLTQKAYQILASKPHEIYIKHDGNPLTEVQRKQVMDNILKANYTIELFRHNIAYSTSNQEKMLESGEEVHMNIVTWYYDQNNTKRFISPGCLTSSKDSTILLTQYQHVGDNNKEQRLRVYDQYVEFEAGDLREHKEATNYIKQRALNDKGIIVDVFKIITEGISQKENKLKDNPVRTPYVFSREILQQLALDLYNQKLSILHKEYKALEKELNNLSEDKKQKKITQRENQAKNEKKDQNEAQKLRHSPQEIKKIYESKESLEKEQKTKLSNEKFPNIFKK